MIVVEAEVEVEVEQPCGGTKVQKRHCTVSEPVH